MKQKQCARQLVKRMADVLAESFLTDPLFQYFFPDDNTRRRLSFYTFKFIISHALKKGYVIETTPALEGIAIWLPSNCIHRDLLDQMRFGALDMLFRQGTAAIHRQKSASEYMQALHAQYVEVPHLYFSTIGVLAAHRGRGYASRLIIPMLEKADKEYLPCYLDTHNENNVGLYQRFGFRIVHESFIPDTTVMHWAMIRQ